MEIGSDLEEASPQIRFSAAAAYWYTAAVGPLEARMFVQNLLFRHLCSQRSQDIPDCDAKSADAGLPAPFSRLSSVILVLTADMVASGSNPALLISMRIYICNGDSYEANFTP